jgi:dihydrofolate synthase/folylpolyglutamate synthase
MPVDLAGWLSYLEQLHPKPIALGLDRVGEVARRLGLEPQFPIVTVAGTNGKGSTCAMLERIYLEAGYHVACYTSPHLLRYNERVRIDGVEASDNALCRAFEAVEHARQDTALTYFEFGTLAAMWLFIESNVQVAVLEVGLGGRLDAVNVFEPSCAILTSVDLDHMDYLGPSRESIGREKAGIYRKDVPAICGDLSPPDTVIAYALDIGAALAQVGRHFYFEKHDGQWDFVTDETRISNLPLPALSGDFQFYNASCALAAVHAMQACLPVSDDALRAGLRHVALQGRFQVFPGAPEVILDVAHNPHAARGLAENLRKSPHHGKTFAVFAMLADKDIPGVVRELVSEIDAWFVADIHEARGARADVLQKHLQAASPNVVVQCHGDVISAFRGACMSAGENDRIAAFGSFYTVADVLRVLPTVRPAS